MAVHEVDRGAFWDRKILKWESDKYESTSRTFFNRSVQARLFLGAHLLEQLAPGASIVEMGCGSARLLPKLVGCNPLSYVGVDISGEAIAEARQLAERLAPGFPVTLIEGTAEDLEPQKADLCFSLGLLDWLAPEEVEAMLCAVSCRYFFHSYSEKRNSPSQQLHRLYAYLMYGHKTGRYVPRYMAWEDVEAMVGRATGAQARVFRSPKLSFGTLVHNLPEDTSFAA